MAETKPTEPAIIEIRKYPNRRYYNPTRSRHLTLEEMRSLIAEGADVRVTDSETGRDITGKVLTQIILELDTPKLDLFPPALLTQLIRVNDQLLKGFIEKFFFQAHEAFLEFQQQMGKQIRQGRGFPGFFSPMGAWGRAVANPWFAAGPNSPPSSESGATPRGVELEKAVENLQAQVALLREQLAKKGKRSSSRRPRRGKSKLRSKPQEKQRI